MTTKPLTALAILTVAISSPVFAAPQKPGHALGHYRDTYNQMQEPALAAPRDAAGTYFDRSFDPSRIGDHDPNFNPPS